MPKLLEFLEFFCGPRKPQYGESPEALSVADLPRPLRQLYAFAADWPRGSGRLLATQNSLVPLSDLQLIDGCLKFAEENQSCWCLGTSPRGSNPEVYFADDPDSPDWSPTGIKLTECLRTFVLAELIFGAKMRTSDTALPKETSLLQLCKQRWTSFPQLCSNIRMYDTDHTWSFFLANDSILVAQDAYPDAEFVYCSANSDQGQDQLESLIDDFGLETY